MADVRVVALNIDGSSDPGRFAVLENVLLFTLAVDPPDGAKTYLPPGIKKGDSASMIRTSLIWWDEKGLVKRDLEYGQLTWPEFDIDQFTIW